MPATFLNRLTLLRLAGIVAALLLIPLVAMQFTAEVNWTTGDFIVAGVLLFGTGLVYEFIASRAGSTAYRIATAIAVVTALLLVWINLAIGIIGSEDNPANHMFAGVLAVGLLGALLARFRAMSMARALVAVAIAQLLVAVIALAAGLANIFPITVLFVALWLLSARLYCMSEPAPDASQRP